MIKWIPMFILINLSTFISVKQLLMGHQVFEWEKYTFHVYDYESKREMNPITASTAFWAANEEKTSASLDKADPPPAKSDRDLIAIKGVFCWRQTKATAALSMSIGVTLNFVFKNDL